MQGHQERHPDLLSSAEAAVVLGVSTRTVERLRANGRIGFTKIGTTVYLSRADVDEYLTSEWQKPKRVKGKAS